MMKHLIGPTGRPTEIAYCVPPVVFAIGTAAEGYVAPVYYPLVYAAKAVAVAVSLYVCRAILADIRWDRKVLMPGILVGIAVFVQWVGVERWIPYEHLGERTGFNPFETLSPLQATAFIVVRFAGLVVLVPIFEELLWRSFLIRYASNPDAFQDIPHGYYTTLAFLLVCTAAALSHTEWLSGFITNAIYCLLLLRTRSVFACVVAHAVTNAILGVYVLTTGNWQLW